jgi:hypothetical protein
MKNTALLPTASGIKTNQKNIDTMSAASSHAMINKYRTNKTAKNAMNRKAEGMMRLSLITNESNMQIKVAAIDEKMLSIKFTTNVPNASRTANISSKGFRSSENAPPYRTTSIILRLKEYSRSVLLGLPLRTIMNISLKRYLPFLQ